jgi:hypothetical protein
MILPEAAPIESVEDLRLHLQYAIGLELTTIPPYLCALYSIKEGMNSEVVEAIQSVVMEEMLHMTLAANVLNAIGGTPNPRPQGDDGGSTIPEYPTTVPFIPDIDEIHLGPLSPASIDVFISIERPVDGAPLAITQEYRSIGQFYQAIMDGVRTVSTIRPDLFEVGAEERRGCQVPPALYYGGAGSVTAVHDLESALKALTQIIDQGEGISTDVLSQRADAHLFGLFDALVRDEGDVTDRDVLPFGWKMYSHYARFKEIRAGHHYRPTQVVEELPDGAVLPVAWDAVWPMTHDPKAEDYEGDYRQAMTRCDETYTSLINALYACFNGSPETLKDAVCAMYELRYQATALMKTPSPHDSLRTLGPGFRYLGGYP